MTEEIKILIAEDNEVSRKMMVSVIQSAGYIAIEASDGAEAMHKIREDKIDAAVIDQVMEPIGGFEFARRVSLGNFNLPIIMVTAYDSANLLIDAGRFGIARVILKPVSPDSLIGSINRILATKGLRTRPIAKDNYKQTHSAEEIMKMVIEGAGRNYIRGNGKPFAAIVADFEGKILGEGRSGKASRSDPIAHAEVMAIRKASEVRGSGDLSDCVLYSSAEPTRVGKALAMSTGIKNIVYSLDREDLVEFIGEEKKVTEPEMTKLLYEEAYEMIKSCYTQSENKYSDN